MRIGLTIWNARISPVCDVARRLLLVEVAGGRVVARREEPLPGGDPDGQAARLAALKPDLLICGACSRPLYERLAALGLEVIPFIAGEVEAVITAHLASALRARAFAMPGCCGRRRWGGGSRGRRGCGRGRRVWGGSAVPPTPVDPMRPDGGMDQDEE
ncbi:MAG: Dinitrogenase iron-molybdenum cofactor [Lentisphaerae bacterium ADurb.BinA184]|nr:MAG: Dinitrogenase iron-molybdenum cofactor [Lentisphaerae bacterium ADurb.BinA184]